MRADLIEVLPVVLREHAVRFADTPAFSDSGRLVTYAELEARTRRLAGHLVSLGVGRGERVAICLRNGVAVVESYLAILRAGAVGVPVNPACTRAELDHVLADSGAVAVITDGVLAGVFRTGTVLVTGPNVSRDTLSFDELAVTEPAVDARDDLGLDEPAWMFYTSGTTGRPKGVLSTQRNCLYSVAASYVPIPGLSGDDRVLWPLPLFHSLSHIACVLSVTVVGATAHILDAAASADDVLTALRENRSTFVAGVPTTYHHLVRARQRETFELPDLRIGLVGGAVAGAELCRAFREAFGTPLVDAYGSTETCGAITMNPPDGPIVDGSCGVPVPGVEVRLVDPDTGEDVPVGVEGEVWASGPNVMLGYHDRPRETAAALKDGWYRTGDLARRDERGYFTVCGRISDLVIRGGENLHPEEVERVLREAPGVADAGVSGRPHPVLGEVPAAYVVPGPSGVDVPALVALCRERLSAYKVPEEVYEVAAIPRTPSGKITRRLLGEQPAVRRYSATGYHHDLALLDDGVALPVADRPRQHWAGSEGIVVVTGAGSGRAAAVVRHLVTVHRVKHLLLVGGVPEVEELADVRWSVESRESLVTALTGVAAPVTTVVHLGSEPWPELEGVARNVLTITDPAESTPAPVTGSLLVWGNGPDRDALSAVDLLLCGERRRLVFGFGAVAPGQDDARSDEAVEAALLAEFAPLDPRARLARLELLVREQAAAVLREADVPGGTAFRDFGITSAGVIELRNRLTARTGLRLPVAVTFDHPTPVALARHLHAEMFGAEPVANAAVPSAAPDDPVVIVGMACRLPGGVTGPDELWRLVVDGADALAPFPTDRGWSTGGLFDSDPGRGGTSYVSQGGFLDGAGNFDPAFFGISPREALAMDPQQRLLLETSWEALEHAGIDTVTLQGTDVGVFTGVMDQGYAATTPQELEAFAITGRAASVASGRISYVLGFTGPAMTVDTACSSSLVALHLAAQALRAGECSLALAGGSTVMATPRMFVEFSRQRALATDGRCKSFASAADGTGWAEGSGVLVLERLSDARRHGHRVLAVVRGSAINSDGASNGLTAPNGLAQQQVITRALANAGLSAADVDAVEAHGTGTVLGDPVEAGALLATYGRNRANPLWLASIKSNIGHTQAAAGVAGVIKMVQALRHELLPATRNVDSPSPRIEWSAGAVSLLLEHRAWPAGERPRRAGVSSFGLSGTNAHVILEEAPAEQESGQEPAEVPGVLPLVVSAHSEKALRAQAERLAALLEHAPFADVAAALATRRTPLRHRAVVVADSAARARTALRALAAGTADPAVVLGEADEDRSRRIVMVFPGQGAQWEGMGRELLDTSPVFARRVEKCARLLAPWVDWSLTEVLRGEASSELLNRVDVVQPASFAVMVGLAAMWESAGVRPDAVVGHSQGEIAAAFVAGALGLADAVRVVAVRSQVIARSLSGGGGMAWVGGDADELGELLAGRISVAAVNGPGSLVVSGRAGVFDEVLAELAAAGLRVRPIAVDYASHSEQVDDVRDELGTVLAGLTPTEPAVPFHSTVDGGGTGPLDGDYWWRNLREQVRFAPVVEELLQAGHGVFVEVSPHPVLLQAISAVGERAELPFTATGSIRRDDGGTGRVLTSMAELFVQGVPVDWSGLLPSSRQWVDLPAYAFDHEYYWLPEAPAADPESLGLTGAGHPLLGAVIHQPGTGAVTATARWSALPWLSGERVPDAALVELAVRLGDEVGTPVVAELTITRPIVYRDGLDVRVVVGPSDADGRRAVEVYSSAGDWVRHAHGVLTAVPPAEPTGFGAPAAVSGDVEVEGFGIHPGLLAGAVGAVTGEGVRVVRWEGVRLHASGATEVQVRAGTTAGQRIEGLELSAPDGQRVLTASALLVEPVARVRGDLFTVDWLPAPVGTPGGELEVYRSADGDPRVATVQALGMLQEFAARPEAGRLVVVVPAVGLAGAAVGGLVRSAQSEHPGRFVLVESDQQDVGASVGDEPWIRLVDDEITVPRLAKVDRVDRTARPLDPDGAVLITGGTGTLGALTARHLVAAHGVRHLVLVSRSGLAAPDARELVADLEAGGAQVDVVAADVAYRDQVKAVLDGVGRPLTAVVHTAGVLDDGVLTALTPDRVDAVFGPKVDAARYLDELTGDLAAFVLYSSAAGVLGNPGQGNYAAANAALDAIARDRHRRGLPAVSLAWGYWQTASGLTSHLGRADLRRNDAIGMTGLSDADGMALLDAALVGGPAFVAARLAPRAASTPLLNGLLSHPPGNRESVRRPSVGPPPRKPAEQSLLDLVRTHAAAVLGHARPDSISADRTFRDAGFDSLTALELRNRLAAATGLKLSPGMVFDHPRPAVLAEFLRAKLHGDATSAPPARTAVPVDEPIAIVSMACRFPAGVRSPEDLWRVVADGVDAVTEFPDDRGWDVHALYHPDPDHDGTTYVRHGAFLDDAAGFDAAFFGISPNEALAMDPQQRLLLETAWETLERAGIDPSSVAGTDIGVFAGINSHDWAVLTHRASGVEGFRLTGGSGGVVSGRIAYHLGLEGPVLTVDTACSSSLVALHLAAQSLRLGECSMALVGGVMVTGNAETFVEFSRQRGLAPDGRCKAFADAADGTGWSEGAGMLLVEPLSSARRHGHQVLAVLRGSAVNSDGASNGLTAPNGPAQQRVIRQALAAAGLRPSEVDAVEAHGTGTTLGDPIEADALLATYGQDRTEPLWLGSVKSNIGHTQAAAGVAGVIKMVMAMRHGTLPMTLHVDRPSTHVDWSSGEVRLLTRPREWPETGRPRRAGVSSFGIGGTNAHVVLEQAPDAVVPAPLAEQLPVPVLLSARTRTGLVAVADRLADFLVEREDVTVADTAFGLASARAHLERRAVVVAHDRDQLVRELRSLTERSTRATGKLAFLMTGQGSQWAGMGTGLAERFPVFATAFERACAAVERHLDAPVPPVRALTGDLLDQTMYTQATVFALETALYRLFESWGVVPDHVAGHSIGEITAAHVSGVLSLDDAGELVAARGALMQALPAGGAMVAVRATEDEVAGLLGEAVAVAAVNSPSSLVLSGDEDAVLAAAGQLAARGRKVRRLPVSHAFHSPRMRPMLAAFREVAARLAYRPATLPVVSTVTGELVTDDRLSTPDHWVRQVEASVRFGAAVTTLCELGTSTFLEVGPGGALVAMALEAPGVPADGCFASLRESGDAVSEVLAAVGGLHTRGVPVDWAAVFGRSGPAAVGPELPVYPFEHRRFWLDGAPTRPVVPGARGPVAPAERPVAGLTRLELVRESIAVVLGHRGDEVFDDDQSFQSLGFDSLSAVRLSRRLHDLTGIEVPATAVFDHPTPLALAAHLDGGQPVSEVVGTPYADEPIAVIGMSTRLPGGVDSPEELWRMLIERRDGISGFPVDRGWDLDGLFHPDPAHPGTSYTRSGGFLHDAARFDAGLFGISPREALAMDPQQRLLLETSWEALERAGVDPTSTRGMDVGVFTGIVHHDYVTRLHRVPEEVQGYLMTGTSPSVASGRVSYVFGFTGPSLTVDTACSSSLVALHLAAQALRRGECSLALAGGATVMSSPDAFLEFSRQRGLAPDGRCKAFSAAADGTGWSEGVGVLVLARLSAAREQGHRVLAVLRGSAVNSDGASNGLTAPNGPAQQRVIRQALAAAGLRPSDVDAVEAHGTGTVLGDPIEAQALLATYGQDRVEPLWLGSLKSNIGHAQAAAGVAGVIKMVQALRHGVLPATLHAEERTRQVDWSSGAVEVLTEQRDWPGGDRPRRCAVSAFGASGTNAHVILEEADREGEQDEPAPASVPLVLSAKTTGSLRAAAARLAAHIRDGAVPLPSVAHTLVTSRAGLPERAVVVADSVEQATAGLAAIAKGDTAGDVVTGTATAPGKVVFVFPGQGAQWVGMGRELMESSPVFAASVTACAEALEPWIDWSLLDVVRGDADLLDRVDVLQPASFAMMIGLAAVWEGVGVRPDAVVGHSQGEIAAACVAGALDLATAVRVVALRSKEIAARLSGRGGMLAVALDEEAARDGVARWDGVEVAVVNGPGATVVAGDADALAQAAEQLAADGVRVRWLPVDYASHTRHVEEVEDALAAVIGDVECRKPRIPFYSTVTGEWVTDRALDGGYWYRNLRLPVRFGPAVEELLRGHGVFVEVSSHPVLAQAISAVATSTAPVVTGTVSRDDGGLSRLLTSAATLYAAGVRVDWKALLPDAGPVRVDLPTYAFEHQHYWLHEAPEPEQVTAAADNRFWASVEGGDVGSLAGLLDLSAEQREAFTAVVPKLADWRRRSEESSAAENLRYAVTWRPLAKDPTGVPGGRWLVVLGEDTPAGLPATLADQGFDHVRLTAGRQDRAALASLLAEVLAEHDITGVLSLLATTERDPEAVAVSALTLLQALGDAGAGAPLWCVTRGAVNAGVRDRVTAPAQAALWGLGRAAALERLDRWGGLIDLPGNDDARTVRHLLGVLAGADGEDQLAIRRSGVYVRRVVRKPAQESAARFRARGTVLVTGGAAGLGRHAARWLAGAGAERLVVTTAGEDASGLAAELGIPVDSCADGEPAVLAALLDADEARPLTAVVHAADITWASLLDDTGAEDVARVFGAKVTTARWLADHLADRELDAFVVFSSIAGVWGGSGQSPSAAANAVLDALVEQRRAAGHRATAIAWGALNEIGVGMDEVALAQLRRRGVLPIEVGIAVTALEQAVGSGETFVSVTDVDWPTFLTAFTSVRQSRLFAELPEAAAVLATSTADTSDATTSLVESLRAVAEPEQNRMLLRLVRSHAAVVLGHGGADGIGTAQAFQEAGFDSLAAVNLRNSLLTATGLTLPATLIFDYPTPEALATHLRDELLREPEGVDEEELRRVLTGVPLARFREAGVLEVLIGLGGEVAAEEPATSGAGDADDDELIDGLDISGLIARVLGSAS